MIVRHDGLTNAQAMVYDPQNRLSAIAQAGVFSDEFGYAYDGARLWKRVDQNPTNIQVWIGNIYEQKDGQTLFHVFAGAEQICTFVAGSPLGGGTNTSSIGYYYHEDNLNTSSALSSSSGSQIEVDIYYPFGRVQVDSPQAPFQISRRFTGQVFDAESGLYYYNARYFDPELGRFIQPDTEIPDLSNPQSYNRYAYCLNDPLTYNDPTGHDFWTFINNWNPTLLWDPEVAQGFGDWFLGDNTFHLDPNSVQAQSQQQGVWFQNIPGVGNAATAPVKAGFGALVQAATTMTPIGEDGVVVKEGTTAVKAGEETVEKLFRGVPAGDTEKSILAQSGVAKPRGTALDAASLEKHVRGEDVNSGVTSWTADRNVAKRFSGESGTIIEVNKSAVANKIVPRPNVGRYQDEREVLVKGTVQGTPTKP
jgi:RHS repeat-associated protein